MGRGRGATRLSLVLTTLLVISTADAVTGCSDCLMYHVKEYEVFPVDQSTGRGVLWFQAEGQFNFTLQFISSNTASVYSTVPVSPDDTCRWRKINIYLYSREKDVYIDGQHVATAYVSSVRGVRLYISDAAKVIISEHEDLLERNDFCPSNSYRGGVTNPGVTTLCVTEADVTEPPTTTSPLEKYLDNSTLLILLAVAVTVAVIFMIYATVIHCKYRKLVLKPVASSMLNFAPEYDQAEVHGNNNELKMSRLGQTAHPQEAATQVTYPQQTNLRQAPPQFSSPRPKSHDSMNSIYDPVILS